MTVIVLVMAGVSAGQAHPRPGRTEKASAAVTGQEANGDSVLPAFSDDGRYVAFYSRATNLVPDDTNKTWDVFIRDNHSGDVERGSVSSDGTEGTGLSVWPDLSGDGRYVAFESESTLVPDDTNGSRDIYVRDRVAGTTERVSVSSDGAEEIASSIQPAISGDGRYVAFLSSGDVAGDGKGRGTFVHDRVTGQTERVSTVLSYNMNISADGRFVVFDTLDPGAVAEDTNSEYDVFVYNRETDTTEWVSVDPSGAPANGASVRPDISGDGRYVVFMSFATNLVPERSNAILTSDIFVKDRLTGAVERVSVTSWGGEGNLYSEDASISDDGRFVLFNSNSSNLVDGDRNICKGPTGSDEPCRDAFVHDRRFGITDRVTLAPDGAESNGRSEYPAISGDGRYVGFGSHATNMVAGDGLSCLWGEVPVQCRDVFVRDRGPDVGIGGVSTEHLDTRIRVTGWATFSGAVLAAASDPAADAVAPGETLGAELTRAEVSVRPEEEDLFVRLHLAQLPSTGTVTSKVGRHPTLAGLPGVIYGLSFSVADTRFEVRGLAHRNPYRERENGSEVAGASFTLYRCTPDCVELGPLEGSIGTTGLDARFSLPLSYLPSTPVSLAGLQAFTALGEAAASLSVLDTVDLGSAVLTRPSVEIGLGPLQGEAPPFEKAGFLRGTFEAFLDRPTEPSQVWARACLGDTCTTSTHRL